MVKPFIYDVELTSTKRHSQFTLPTAYTNDLDVIEFQFKILDDIDLTGATANVILFMQDGSFFQNDETSGVTIEGKTVKYTMKENEGNHSGTSEVQLVVLVNGLRYASPKYKFRIENGLETDVAVEIMIQDWTTLTREAREFIAEMKANETQRQTDFDYAQTSNQSTFNDNESNRQSAFELNEQTRQANEDIRVSSEETRKLSESERANNEEGRVAAEETRVNQEEARVSAEVLRMEQFQDMQLTQDLDTKKSYKTTLEIFNGMPRLKLEEVTHG